MNLHFKSEQLGQLDLGSINKINQACSHHSDVVVQFGEGLWAKDYKVVSQGDQLCLKRIGLIANIKDFLGLTHHGAAKMSAQMKNQSTGIQQQRVLSCQVLQEKLEIKAPSRMAQMMAKYGAENIQNELNQVRQKLVKPPVYFASTNTFFQKALFPTHGFLVAGRTGNEAKVKPLDRSQFIECTYAKGKPHPKVDAILQRKITAFIDRTGHKPSESERVSLREDAFKEYNDGRFDTAKKGRQTLLKAGVSHTDGTGKVFQLSSDIMLSKIKVNKVFIEAVMKNKGIPEQTKTAIGQLKGSEYQYVEYFILDVIKQEKKLNPNENIDVDDTLRAFQKSAPEAAHYKKLISIYRKSMGMKMNFSTPFSSSGAMVRDEKLFNLHKVVKSKLDISITSLQDIIREQRIAQEFKHEKLGIGKATEQLRKRPQDLTMGQLAPLIKNDVQYARFPKGKYESNCNKTAASLYQLAKNREIASQEVERRTQQASLKQGEIIAPRQDHQKVKTPTLFSIGSGAKERMALWQGVKA